MLELNQLIPMIRRFDFYSHTPATEYMDIPEEQRFSTVLKQYSILREIVYDQMLELCPLARNGEPIDAASCCACVCGRRRSEEAERRHAAKLREAGPPRFVGDNQVLVGAIRLTYCRTPIGRTHPGTQQCDTVL